MELRDLFKKREGQTTTEYVLLLVVVALIIMRLRGTLQEKLTGLTEGVFEKVGRELNDQ